MIAMRLSRENLFIICCKCFLYSPTSCIGLDVKPAKYLKVMDESVLPSMIEVPDQVPRFRFCRCLVAVLQRLRARGGGKCGWVRVVMQWRISKVGVKFQGSRGREGSHMNW